MRSGLMGLLAVLIVGVSATVPGAPAEPAAHAGSVARETLVLKNGNKLCGEVLREKADAIVLDLGFLVVSVPLDEIARRVKSRERVAGTSRDGDSATLYREATDDLKERPVKKLVEALGESVALVSTPAGMGSGFITDRRGYVVTNCHVILGEQEVSVTLFRKKEGVPDRVKIDKVKIVSLNPFSDLALLKFDIPKGMIPKPVFLGSSEAVRDGQRVFAIGNPLGLERTVSEGIISSARRSFNGQVFVQTTVPINPGNSGGPLFNLRGEVIGVTNMKAGFFTEGLGFAIPVNTLKFFLRNRDIFAFDKDNPNTGYHYLAPPRKAVKPESRTGRKRTEN